MSHDMSKEKKSETKDLKVTKLQMDELLALNNTAQMAASELTVYTSAIMAGHSLKGYKIVSYDSDKLTMKVQKV